MDEKPPSNIFEEAERGSKKAKDIPVTPASAELAKANFNKQETEDMFKKIYKLQDDVAKKLDEVYQTSGLTAQEIQLFIENPHNLNDKARILLQKKKALLDRLTPYEDKKKTPVPESQKTDDPKAAAKRKGKSLGARKGWLQI